ncbi:lantibiotic dehydratase [Tumebacillus permanentifrigoris]|uniref:Thiopeptide-type bacteriocin biosynthesis protein n=1 Tax=Tumebacillus permanentifrigoris TaxID=378543 RepID=A0A316DB34_9BACL|nr:lantibiotic dehydratase [Tumebacillus permanentifrigoris]PWK15012.1 thiopeptide-type bacteriocin biosynthesis protein [Tumebacillus permanentifrigoris]
MLRERELSTIRPIESQSSGFQALDVFMMRTPVLPLRVFEELQSDDPTAQLAVYAQDPMIREAIAVASTSLLESLPQMDLSAPPRKREQAAKGLMRYLIRMSTRSTPFGLFSGVTHGHFADVSDLQVSELPKHRKRSRPDMNWLLKILERLESDPAVIRQLHVSTNPMAYRHGSRWKLPYVTRYGQRGNGNDIVSIRNSPVVEFGLQNRPGPVPFESLILDIIEAFPGATDEMVRTFLLQLFEQEFLVSNLRPPTTTTDPYAYVLHELSKLQGVDELYASLQSIHDRMIAYDALPIGEGEQQYLELVAEMKAMAEVTTALQVDLALHSERVHLPESVRADVEGAAEVMWRMSARYKGLPHIAKYHEDFVEKYGYHREVSLLELLDEDIGMGAPSGYQHPASRRQLGQGHLNLQNQREQLVAEWFAETLQKGLPELELTAEHIQLLQGTDSLQLHEAPPSMELYFQVLADSPEDLDQGKYELFIGGNYGSAMAYKTFGRFVDMMEDGFAGPLQEAARREEAIEPEAIWAEVSYLPNMGRATNVVLTRHARSYEIPMGTNASTDPEHTIAFHDLVVGATDKYLYLKSRSLNREVIPTACHMLNHKNTPNVYRFLRDIGLARYAQWAPFQWGQLDAASYLPRVRHGRVVLQSAQWKMRKRDAWYEDSMSDDAFFQAVQAWRDDWKAPKFVYLALFDNRMLLDLTKPHHVEEIRKELKQTGKVTLVETGQLETRSIVRGSGGVYASEFVFSLIRREPEGKAPTGSKRLAKRTGYEGPRIYLPGSEWMYMKLYGIESRQEEFMATKLIELLSAVSQQGLVDKAYFMRYADPDMHIRLRLHGQPDVLSSRVMPLVHQWSTELLQDGMLSKLVLDAYEPEVERYGGPELMKLVEQVFHADSMVVANWVKANRFGGLQLPFDLVGVLSVLDYLEQFGYSFSEQVELMDQAFGSKEHLDLFRTYRKTILDIANPQDEWAGLRAHPDGALLHGMLKFRAPIVKRYAQEVRAADERGELFGPYRDLVFSVIHLHMNRLYGIDLAQERKTMILTRHALNAMKHFRRDEL